MIKYFTSLFTTNFFGVLNDNFLKTLACFIAIKWVAQDNISLVVSMAAGALVLPYIFFSPLAGRWAHIFSKQKIVYYAKIIEVPIMLLAVLGFIYQSVYLVLFSIFLMGLQSSLYSPAKYGLIREVGGEKNISYGMGGMEAVSFLGMLVGTLLSGLLVDMVSMKIIYILLISFALLGLLFSSRIKINYEDSDEELVTKVNPLVFIKDMYARCKDYEALNPIIMSLSMFWWLVASLQMGLIVYCQQTLNLSPFNTGIVLSLAAIGITVGCYVAGLLLRTKFLYRWVVVSGFVISTLLVVLCFVELSVVNFAIILFFLSLVCGFFKVPLDTAIQQKVKGSLLAPVLAYFNQVSFIFILFASLTFAIISILLPPNYLFLMLGVGFLFVPFYLLHHLRSMLCYVVRSVFRLRYKVKITGLHNLSDDNTYLVLPNHQAVVDPMILFSEMYHITMRPLVDKKYLEIPIASSFIRIFDAVSVPDLTVQRDINTVNDVRNLEGVALDALNKKQTILLYPAGRITIDGVERICGKQLAYKICKELPSGVKVIGVRINGLWGSVWSRKGRTKTPPFLLTLIKTFLFVVLGGLFIKKRREVVIEIVDITDKVSEWAEEDTKVEFNNKLEQFYNN
ncbi:MAG: MFS transporter [Bacteroidetes bacterium]|nr:MFS transporter [Bacteroidota bacterium]